jgi:hypothetical protein
LPIPYGRKNSGFSFLFLNCRCGWRGQIPGGDLGNVQQLRRSFTDCGECVAEHAIAEGAGGGDGLGSSGHELGGTVVTDALARFLAEKGQTAAGSAAEASFATAWGLDQLAGGADNGAGFVVDVSVAAQVAGVVKDDGLRSFRG